MFKPPKPIIDRPKPTHVYTARKQECGCCTGICNADNDKFTAEWVAGFIQDGLRVNLVTWEMYVSEVSQENTFMSCTHQEPANNLLQPELESSVQLELFGASN